MTTIYLIRHGQASIGSSNYDILSALGQKQATVLGKYFARTQITFDHVVSGTLKRQIDTATIALQGSAGSHLRNAGFNEYPHNKIFEHYAKLLAPENEAVNAILTHGHNSKLTFPVFAALMNAWVDDNTAHGDLESWDQFTHRIKSALTATIEASEADTIAVFTSGGVICTILHMITRFPVEKIFEINWGIYNSSVTTLKNQNNTLRLSAYNSIAHLELENDHTLITNI